MYAAWSDNESSVLEKTDLIGRSYDDTVQRAKPSWNIPVGSQIGLLF